MEESSAELNFSLPELEEAGLLQPPTCSDAAIAAPTQSSDVRAWPNQDFLSYVNDEHKQHQGHAQHAIQLEKLSDPSLSNIPDKRLANREYQKRFRAKQKARTQAVTDQLADATEELQKLRLQRQELEIKLGQTQAQLEARLQADSSKPPQACSSFDTTPLNISLPGKERQLTFQEARSMPSQQYYSIYQDYCIELQKQIAVLQPNAESRLCQLVLEAMHFRAYCNAFMLKNAQKRMEPTPKEAADIHQKVQKVVGILDLSKEQVQDLMFLRRIYFLRRHELQTQRAALRSRAEELEAEPMYATSRMANVNRQLNHNGIEDIQTMLRFSWTIYLGVFTIKQAAQVLSSFSAEFAIREPLWNYIAQQNGFPTQQKLIQNAPFGLTQYEWTRAWQYTESCSRYHPVQTRYVPIPKLQPAPCPSRSLY